MAIISHISLITLTCCVLILFMCQINLSMARSLSQTKHHNFPLQQQQNDRLAFLNEYLRQNYPINSQQESSYNVPIYIDSNIGEEPISRLHEFKRDSPHQNTPGNKRMLCFFHAVNCFG